MSKDSITIAYDPLEVNGKSTLGIDFSDRPYLNILKEKQQPYVTDVVMGKFGKPMPIVMLLAPIIVKGEYQGYATGVVNIAKISAIFNNLINPSADTTITLVDGNWKVIASTLTDLKIMDKFLRPYNRNNAIKIDETFHWIPEPQPGTSIMQRWLCWGMRFGLVRTTCGRTRRTPSGSGR